MPSLLLPTTMGAPNLVGFSFSDANQPESCAERGNLPHGRAPTVLVAEQASKGGDRTGLPAQGPSWSDVSLIIQVHENKQPSPTMERLAMFDGFGIPYPLLTNPKD
jgi:hypothetical protein